MPSKITILFETIDQLDCFVHTIRGHAIDLEYDGSRGDSPGATVIYDALQQIEAQCRPAAAIVHPASKLAPGSLFFHRRS